MKLAIEWWRLFELCRVRSDPNVYRSHEKSATKDALRRFLFCITLLIPQQPSQQIHLRKVSHGKVIQKIFAAQQQQPRLLWRRTTANKISHALLQTL